MNQVVSSLPFAPEDPLAVSIVQIRCGGAKGTLVAWDQPGQYVSCRNSADVILRDSMVKFKHKYEEVEVCSFGKRIPYHLNRSVIFLLHSLGVPFCVFHNLQLEMLDFLD
jgi:hypothetical protein